MFVMLSMVGFTLPNVQALALADHGRTAGAAAGLIGSSNMALGAFTAPLVGAFGTASAVPMATIMLAATAGSVTAFLVLVRPSFRRAADTADAPASAPVTQLQPAAADG
ncbi:MAG: multidrug effflux MFS transporter [Actinobacteria bacterium]|nr:multidrug effflux MFS transporter [Actinomycetota bacterium]NIU68390.1 multidrug effflux MFS transporter [Actinomycetota bacterium]NIW30214.1 hypothetical protein [Actinomycetota bacterium]